jgi:hypothetical protein
MRRAFSLPQARSTFFTEVNRNRPPPDATAFPCFSLNPQVHAFDNATMVENLAGQAADVESAKELSPKPVVVSPITLRIRQKTPQDSGELSADVILAKCHSLARVGPSEHRSVGDDRKYSLLNLLRDGRRARLDGGR